MQQSQKYRKKNIPKAVRIAVWNEFIGEEIGRTECYVGCKRTIAQSNFECGHIEPESRGGLTIIDNLRPICGDCNRSMGTRNMHEFMKTFGFKKDKEYKEIIVLDDNETIVIEDEEDEEDEEEEEEKETILIDDKETILNEPLNYFLENCIEYKKGNMIRFDDMYQLFIGICPAFYDTNLVESINKEQFIDYFIDNFYNYDCEFNVLYDYKFKYEVNDGEYEEYEEIGQEFFDTQNIF